MRFTLFTPTYNRAYCLERLYRSIQCQTFRDFEWLVIDDGSTDNTKELFDTWKKEENDFPIRYYYFDNSGKQREINRALDLAKGDLFFTIDSDDMITENALELIDSWENTIVDNSQYCAVAGSDGDFDSKPQNPLFQTFYIDATFLDRYSNSERFIGHDRPWVFYTDVHRRYKYPEFENEKFITEAVTWNRMANDGYKVRCFNNVVYLREHQEDGLTFSILNTLVSNPKGYGLWVKEQMDYLKYNPIKKFVRKYSFYCDMCHKYNSKQIAKFLMNNEFEILFMAFLYKIKNNGGIK